MERSIFISRIRAAKEAGEPIGDIIKDFRLSLGLSPEGFAGAVGVSLRTLQRWERNESQIKHYGLRKLKSLTEEDIAQALRKRNRQALLQRTSPLLSANLTRNHLAAIQSMENSQLWMASLLVQVELIVGAPLRTETCRYLLEDVLTAGTVPE